MKCGLSPSVERQFDEAADDRQDRRARRAGRPSAIAVDRLGRCCRSPKKVEEHHAEGVQRGQQGADQAREPEPRAA